MNLPSADATAEAIIGSGAGLIVDAIFGTGLTQPPRPPFAELVAAIEKTSGACPGHRHPQRPGL